MQLDMSNRKYVVSMLKGAYKKLKLYYYYDKTLLYIKEQIANFEADNNKFSNTFGELADAIINKNMQYFTDLMEDIPKNFLVFPKKMSSDDTDANIVKGYIERDKNIRKVNYFIQVPIELLIVDCLWTLWIAKISKPLIDSDKNEYATYLKPSLFNNNPDLYFGIDYESNRFIQPYYNNYKRWQNDTINCIRENVKKCNVLLVGLDIKSFYYSVCFNFSYLNTLFNDKRLDEINFITQIIEKIYNKYTLTIKKYKPGIKAKESQCIFPIGLLSPLILREVYLHGFDEDIMKCLSPLHYGRYVDDMLLVFNNVEKDVTLKNLGQIFENAKIISKGTDSQKSKNYWTFVNYPNLCIQKEKICCFSFQKNTPNALLKIVEQQIKQNSSESNLLPDDLSTSFDFSQNMYFYNSIGGSKKIRDIGILQSDNYSTSKKIAALKRLLQNTYIPKPNQQIDQAIIDILEFYSGSQSIEYMSNWTSVFELFVLYKSVYDKDYNIPNYANEFCKIIESYITKLNLDSLLPGEIYKKKSATIKAKIKKGLRSRLDISISLVKALDYDFEGSSRKLRHKRLAINFRKSNLFNHRLVCVPLINYLPYEKIQNCSLINFYEIKKSIKIGESLDKTRLEYSPRFIHLEELHIYLFFKSFGTSNYDRINNIDEQKIFKRYLMINNLSNFSESPIKFGEVRQFDNNMLVQIETNMYSKRNNRKFSIGLVNTPINELDVANILLNYKLGITLDKKQALYDSLNSARHNNADVVVFPEFYMPLIWVSDIMNFSKVSQIVVITGMQYITFGQSLAKNFSCVMQPTYAQNRFQNCVALFREKNYYAPQEKLNASKLGYLVKDQDKPLYYVIKNSYNDFSLRFSLVLCYEFTDIYTRASLKSNIDILFVPQLNKDTHYFSSIVESAARDLHCFIVQSNTSIYGDSRITAPYNTLNRNIVQIKGGKNEVVIIGDLEVEQLIYERENYESRLTHTIENCLRCKKIHCKGILSMNQLDKCKKCTRNLMKKETKIKGLPPNYNI